MGSSVFTPDATATPNVAAPQLTFDAGDLAPLALAIGRLIGLIVPDPDDASRFAVNFAWFEDPRGWTRGDGTRSPGFADIDVQQALSLLTQIIGSAAGQTLGVPQAFDGALWYNLPLPVTGGAAGANRPSPFYIVAASPQPSTPGTVFGLGVNRAFTIAPSVDPDTDGLTITPYVSVPLVQVDGKASPPVSFVIGDQDHPLELGVTLQGAAGLFGSGAVSFDGLQFAARVSFTGALPTFELVFVNLTLPGQPTGNYSLSDLQALGASTWIAAGLNVVAAQVLRHVAPETQARVQALLTDALALLGVAGDLPALDWSLVASLGDSAADRAQNAKRAFLAWASALVTTPNALAGWLETLGDAFRGQSGREGGAVVSGRGTSASPYALPLLHTTIAIGAQQVPLEVDLTAWSDVDADGVSHLVPGLSVAFGGAALPGAWTTTVPVVVASAHADVLDLALDGQGGLALFPTLSCSVALGNQEPSKPLVSVPDPAAADATFQIGAFQAGFAYQRALGAVTPTVQLTNLTSAAGSWAVIDLTNVAQVIQVGEQILAQEALAQLQKFFGFEAGVTSGAPAALAAALGIVPPPGQSAWPLQTLLSADGTLDAAALDRLLASPTGWLAAYFRDSLVAPQTGPAPFVALVGGLAQVFGWTGASTSGAGTQLDPWSTPLFASGGVTLSLTAFSASPADLQLGVTGSFQLDVGGDTLTTSTSVGLVAVHLPDAAGGGLGAVWVPGAEARIEVAPPTSGDDASALSFAVAGLTVASSALVASGGWTRASSWYVGVTARQVTLSSARLAGPIALGDLAFIFTPETAAGQALAQLAQPLVYLAGAFLLQLGGSFGVAAATVLGLLPDLYDYFESAPAGQLPCKLPDAQWPTIVVTDGQAFFQGPWDLLVGQLAALFAKPAYAATAVELVAWALGANSPATAPAGDREDPYRMAFPQVFDVEVLLWSDPSTGGAPGWLGFGLQRVVSATLGPIAFQTVARADVARLALPGAQGQPDGAIPLFTLEGTFTPASGDALAALPTGATVTRAVLGGGLDTSGVLTPTVSFDLSGQTQPIVLSIPPTDTQALQLVSDTLGAFMVWLTGQVQTLDAGAPDTPLQAALSLLADLGLVTTDTSGAPQAVSASGFQALVADPYGALQATLAPVLADPERQAAFMADLQVLLGIRTFQLPPGLAALSVLLEAVGLLTETSGGKHAVVIQRWLDLWSHPVTYLEDQLGALFTDPARLAQVVTELQAVATPTALPPLPWGLRLTVTNGNQVTLDFAQPLAFADVLRFAPAFTVDLKALTFGATATLWSTVFGAGLTAAIGLGLDTGSQPTATWSLALTSPPDPTTPAPFDPIPLCGLPSPFDGSTPYGQSVQALFGRTVPLFVLATATTGLLDAVVLPSSPFARTLLGALGLTTTPLGGGTPRAASLVGLFMHPTEWLLSPAVVGDGQGHLDLQRLAELLASLVATPVVGPAGVTLAANQAGDGVVLTGLPFAASTLSLAADATSGLVLAVNIDETLPAPAPPVEVQLDASLTVPVRDGVPAGPVQPAGTLSLTLPLPASGAFAGSSVTVITGYSASAGFSLAFSGQMGGTPFPAITLVPFTGFSLSGAAKALFPLVAQKAWDAFQSWPNKPAALSELVASLQLAANAVGIDKLVDPNDDYTSKTADFDTTALAGAVLMFARSPAAAGQWLASRLVADLSTSIPGLYTLLTGQTASGQAATDASGGAAPGFGLTGFTLEPGGQRLAFTPTLGTQAATVTVAFGNVADSGDPVLGVIITPNVTLGPVQVSAGLGVGAAGLGTSTVALSFTATATAQVLLPESARIPPVNLGPALVFTVDAPAWSLTFYPAGLPTGDAAFPAVALLPSPGLVSATASAPPAPLAWQSWLRQLGLTFLGPLLADLALRVDTVTRALTTSLIPSMTTGPTLAQVLSAFGLLAGPTAPLAVADLTAFAASFVKNGQVDFLAVVTRLVSAVLETVAAAGVPLLDIDHTSDPNNPYRILVTLAGTKAGDGSGTDYALDLTVRDLSLTQPGAWPGIVLQVGAWQSADASPYWIAETAKVGFQPPNATPTQPGILIDLVKVVTDAQGAPTQLSFAPALTLASVGVDVRGTGNGPLVSKAGFALGSIQPRVYFYADATPAVWLGASIELDDLSLPLAGSGPPAAGSNPIANNLMGSALGSDTPNPAFSGAVSYVAQLAGAGSPAGNFHLALHGDGDGDTPDQLWIPIQRQLGPLYCRALGVGWAGGASPPSTGHLLLGFDGQVAVGPLQMDVVQLDIGLPVTHMGDVSAYTLDLAGLDVAFEGGSVTIGGGLVKQTLTISGKSVTAYDGMLTVAAGAFGISAAGQYAELDGSPSFFVYGVVDAPIGGPPSFFITGGALGFGFNSQLHLPQPDAVAAFPLVAWANDPHSAPTDIATAFTKLATPSLGDYWLAAGLRFTTYEMLQSFGMLVATFGRELIVSLMGTSSLTVPVALGGSSSVPTAIAQVTLQFSVTFMPDRGEVAVGASLTPDSWLLAPDVHLTGGFAFYLWFDPGRGLPPNPHAGEFVLTLGGYHPAFQPPSYYPSVDRVGYHWQPDDSIQLRGGCYFALTPHAAMAGFDQSLTFSAGPLAAWFDARADFIVWWKPFYFVGDISISIGASLRVDLLFVHHTFKVEMGASLRLYGPPIGGRVRVDWYILSFSIGFGASENPNAPLADWSQFDQSFLPQTSATTPGGALAALGDDDAPAPNSASVVTASVATGLLGNAAGAQGSDPNGGWIVDPGAFSIVARSVVPASELTTNDNPDHSQSDAKVVATNASPLVVVPMAKAPLTSPLDVTLIFDDAPYSTEFLVATPATSSVPDSLWSPDASATVPASGSAGVTQALTSLTLTPMPQAQRVTLVDHLPSFPQARLAQGDDWPVPVTWDEVTPAPPPTAPAPTSTAALEALQAALAPAAPATSRRASLFAALATGSSQLVTDPATPVMRQFAPSLLQAAPSLVTTGGELPPIPAS